LTTRRIPSSLNQRTPDAAALPRFLRSSPSRRLGHRRAPSGGLLRISWIDLFSCWCSAMVFLESEMSWNVLIAPSQLDRKGLLLRKAIIVRLLEDVTNRRASKEHGYYVAVNQLKAISEGKVRELTGDVLFPVTFTCITQKPMKGEIMVGYVDRILKHGMFLKSGPVESIFMAEKSMGDYKYIGGENPMFMNDQSKLEKDTAVRFKVLGFRWMEADRQFQLLATIAGDFLGPL
ncbi:unnamed protein product, partial [Urochloa humidicola]